MSRRLQPASLAVLALLLCTCATGRKPPEPTAMAEVTDGLSFLFGMGELGCTIPTEAQCKDKVEFDPGMPAVRVQVPAFAFDVHEVTNEQYRFCEEMGACSKPAGDNGPDGIPDYYTSSKYDPFPVVLVTWLQAKEYCAFVGKRLPTEFEWERVAGGPAQKPEDKLLFPFAAPGPGAKLPAACADKKVNLAQCSAGFRQTKAVMTSVDDAVQVGGKTVFDLSGNVSEWTASDADDGFACDASQPYDCEECVKCIETKGKDDAGCKANCQACKCGDGDPATKPNCYLPCDNPVCPSYPAGAAPIARPYTDKNLTAKRIIRGGNFETYSDDKTTQCIGRSDARLLASRPDDDPLLHLGFRCARNL